MSRFVRLKISLAVIYVFLALDGLVLGYMSYLSASTLNCYRSRWRLDSGKSSFQEDRGEAPASHFCFKTSRPAQDEMLQEGTDRVSKRRGRFHTSPRVV